MDACLILSLTALVNNNTDVYMHFKTILPTVVVTIKMYSITDSLIVKFICLSYTLWDNSAYLSLFNCINISYN